MDSNLSSDFSSYRIEGPSRGTLPAIVKGAGPDSIEGTRLADVHRGARHGHSIHIRSRVGHSRSVSSGAGTRIDMGTGQAVGTVSPEVDFRITERSIGR